MKKMKPCALLLAVALILAAFSACGGGTTSTKSSAAASETAEPSAAVSEVTSAAPTGSTAEETTAVPESAAESGGDTMAMDPAVGYDLPLFDPAEDVRFSMWVSFSDIGGDFMPDGYASNKGYLESVEDTGVNIDMIQVSTETNAEKFNVMVASGEFPDIITNVSQIWTGSYDQAVDEDIFLDLTDMVENYMPYYKQAYDGLDDGVKRDLHTDNGYMPKLISINANPDGATEGAFIRKDKLDSLGLDVPETYDDLANVLAAFKDSGMAEPLMLVSGITHTSNALCSGYGVSGMFATAPMTAEPFYVEDGTVKYGIVEDGYKEYMQMLVDYYKAGYIDPDFITDNTNPMGADFMGKCESDDVGLFFGEANLIPNYYADAANADYELVPLAPVTKAAGDQTHFGTVQTAISGRLAAIAVTTNAEDRQEELGKYLDFFFTEKGALLSAMGTEGNEDGSYVVESDGSLAYSENWNALPLTENQKPTLYIYSVMPMLKPKVPSTYTMDLQFECADIWDQNADSDYRMPDYLTMTTEEIETYGSIYSDIQTSVQENLSKFLVGDRPMSEWDAFVDTLWSMGMQDCIDIKQAAYDRYLSRAV